MSDRLSSLSQVSTFFAAVVGETFWLPMQDTILTNISSSFHSPVLAERRPIHSVCVDQYFLAHVARVQHCGRAEQLSGVVNAESFVVSEQVLNSKQI